MRTIPKDFLLSPPFFFFMSSSASTSTSCVHWQKIQESFPLFSRFLVLFVFSFGEWRRWGEREREEKKKRSAFSKWLSLSLPWCQTEVEQLIVFWKTGQCLSLALSQCTIPVRIFWFEKGVKKIANPHNELCLSLSVSGFWPLVCRPPPSPSPSPSLSPSAFFVQCLSVFFTFPTVMICWLWPSQSLSISPRPPTLAHSLLLFCEHWKKVTSFYLLNQSLMVGSALFSFPWLWDDGVWFWNWTTILFPSS